MRRTPRPATTLITDVGGSVLLLTVATLILAPSTSAQVGCNQSNTGQSFIVAFTQSPQSPTKTLTLFVGSTANPIRVTVTYPNSSSTTSDAGAFNHTAIQIPADMELLGSGGIESKAIQVTTNDTATVVGLTEQGNYSEAYLALPLSALGRQYFTAGYAPQGGDAARVIYLSQFAIAATTDATNVTVTLSGMFTGVLYFRLVNYTAGQKINFLLNRFQAVQFQSTADLTGSEVTANNQVAVWAGNLAARLDGSTENHVVEQMLPVWASGTSFAVGSLPGNYPYAVKVVAVSPATSITYVEQISSSQSPNIVSQTLARSGDYLTIYEPSRGIVISASGTLIVCQMTNQTSSPAMAVVPPVSGFLAQYRFVVPTKTLREFNVFSTVLVNSAYQSQLIYDASFNLGTLAWTNVPGSVYNVSQVPTSHLVNAVHRIDGPTRFSVTVQGSSSGQPLTSYFYPAGFCLLPLAVSNTGPSQAASDTTSQIVLKSTALRSSSYTTGSTVISTLTTTTTGPVIRNSTQPISSNTIPSAISSPTTTTTTTTTTLISSHRTTPSSTRKTPLPIVPGNDNQASASDTTRRTTPFTTITTTSSTAGVSLRTTPFSISTLPTSTSTTTSQTSSSTTSSGISLRTTPFTSSTTSASIISGRTTPLSSSTTVSSGIYGRTTPLFSSATSASSASSSSSIRLIRTTPPFVSSSTTLPMPSTLPTSGPTLISSSSTTLPSSSPLTSGPPLSSSTALPASTTLPTSGQTLLSSPTATSFTSGPPATLSSTTSSPGTVTTLPSALSTSGVSPFSSLVPPSFSPPSSTLIPASFSTSLTPGPPISSSLTPGPPVSSSLTPGPPLSSSLTPGPPVSSSLTPGPPVLSSSTPGPPVSSSLTPGPPISSSLTPGPPLSSSLTPGPPVSLSLTPGPPVSSSLTPGPPVLSSSTPGPPVSSSLTPGPPISSSLTPGPPLTSSLTPGPPVSSSQTAVSFTPGPPATLLSTTSLSGTATTLPSSQPTSGVLPPFLSSGLPSSSSSPTSIPTALSTATGLSTTSTSSSTASPSLTPGPPSPSLSSSSATPGLPPSSTPTAGPPLLSSATSGLPASPSLPTTSGPITGIPTAGIVFPVSIRRSVPGTDVVIQMVNPGSDPVQVIIRYSGSDYPFVIPGRNETSWTVPRSSNAVMDAETVLITASGPIVVTVLQIGSCSAYLPLPIAALGTEYQIITWNTSSWFYLTSEQQAIVRITFPQGSCRIRSGNLTFFCGDDFALDLSPGSTVIFTSTSDLSGAYIRSDSPVSVLAGNTNTTTIGTGNIADSAATTLFPVYAWGLNFAVAPVPNNDGFGYSLKIGSGRGSATVTIYTDSTRTYSLSSGGIITVNVASNQPAYVTSNVPIQVVQFVNSANAGGGASGAPASLSIPSRERYTKSYVFGSVSRFMNYIVVVIDGGSASGFRLNDQPTTSDGWRTVPGSTLVTRAFPIAAGAPSGSVAHPTQNFGAFRFSYIANDATYGTCQLAYTAGALLPVQQVSSSTVATTFPTLATSFPTQPTPPPSSGRNLLVRDCSCLNISSELQPLYDGYYYALNDTLNGQPVYKRQDCDVYLFLYLGSASYWVVGPRPGTNRGVLLNSAIFQAAAEAQRWEGYNTTENAFEPEPSFAASCSCPATSCRSVEVVNDDGESVFNGVFFFIYTTFNGRPVFRHEDGNLFLYYQVTGTCQRWVVSSSIGGQAAVLYANDRSADVAAIPPSTVWRYFRGAGFVDEPDIELRCYPASSGVPS